MLNGTDTLKRLLCCTVGGTGYCLDMASVLGVESLEPLVQAESNHPAQSGWLINGEQRMPVYNLRATFSGEYSGFGEISETEGRIVVCEDGADGCGLFVDRVTGMIEMPVSEILPLPTVVSQNQTNPFTGLVRIENELKLFADPRHLLPGAELRPQPLPVSSSHKFTLPVSAGAATREHGQLMLFATSQEQVAMERPILFGISITQVLELTEPLSLIPIPGAPAYVCGLVSWRDYPVPVIDLNTRFWTNGSLSEEHKKTRLMIVRATGDAEPFGLLIEPGIRMLTLPVIHAASQRPLAFDQRMVKGVYELDEVTLIVPDLENLTTLPAQ